MAGLETRLRQLNENVGSDKAEKREREWDESVDVVELPEKQLVPNVMEPPAEQPLPGFADNGLNLLRAEYYREGVAADQAKRRFYEVQINLLRK